jgi:hypothetical protein
LTLAPEELEQFCGPLARQAVEGMRQALARAHAAVPAMALPDALWITADAARLPGLVALLAQHLPESAAVRPLPAGAAAVAAYVLADRLDRGHLDSAVPLDNRSQLRTPVKPAAARPV